VSHSGNSSHPLPHNETEGEGASLNRCIALRIRPLVIEAVGESGGEKGGRGRECTCLMIVQLVTNSEDIAVTSAESCQLADLTFTFRGQKPSRGIIARSLKLIIAGCIYILASKREKEDSNSILNTNTRHVASRNVQTARLIFTYPSAAR